LQSFASKFQQIEDSGLKLGTSNKIWNELHDTCNGILTAKGWYTFVKGKQLQLFKLIGVNASFSAVQPQDEVITTLSSDNELSDDDDDGSDKNTFTVSLTRFEWDAIKPENITYALASGAQRTRLRLKKGAWTGMMANKLNAVAAKPCVWIFDNSLASSSAVKIDGHCKHCESTFSMNLDTIPEEVESGDPDEYFATFTTKFSLSKKHCTGKEKNKRQLRGVERAEMAARLKKTTVSAARQHIIEHTMSVGDTDPPVLYSASVLRKVKSVSRADIFDALLLMKTNDSLHGVIQHIGFSPFFVHYSTHLQDCLYREEIRSTGKATLVIDATGTVALPIKRDGHKTTKILLYQALLIHKSDLSASPVAQMLSDCHDCLAISTWLQRWLLNVKKPPTEVICDFSLALIGAAVRSFTMFSTTMDYINWLYNPGTESSDSKKSCFIRIDVAHIMHCVARWDCIKRLKNSYAIKELCMGSIALMVNSNSIELAESVLTALCHCLLGTHTGEKAGGGMLPTNESKDRLLAAISTRLPQDLEQLVRTMTEQDDMDNEDNDVRDEECCNDAKVVDTDQEFHASTAAQRIEKIFAKAKEAVADPAETAQRNPYFLPTIERPLRNLCLYIPMWTLALGSKFDVNNRPSSAKVEAYFKTLKHDGLFSPALPLSVPEFLSQHVKIINNGTTLRIAGS
jgi:hypothetical protein